MRRPANIAPSAAWARSFLATTISPLVLLSSRCTMPGRNSPPVEESVLKRCNSAFTSVPPLRAAIILPRASVHHHAGRLVHHGQVGVFVDHVKWNGFRNGFQRRRMRLAGDQDAFATAQFERRLLSLALDQHIALRDEQLHTRAAHAFKLRDEELVETLRSCFSGHIDGALCAHEDSWPSPVCAARSEIAP